MSILGDSKLCQDTSVSDSCGVGSALARHELGHELGPHLGPCCGSALPGGGG